MYCVHPAQPQIVSGEKNTIKTAQYNLTLNYQFTENEYTDNVTEMINIYVQFDHRRSPCNSKNI